MKCFRSASLYRLAIVSGLVLLIASAGWAAMEWANAEAGSTIEAALYRWMSMPVSKVLGLRPPREAVPLIGELIRRQPTAELYALRALSEEAALDFTAAENDWRKYTEAAGDKSRAQIALADFYQRRLRPMDEVAALMVVARAPADDHEKLAVASQQHAWQAFERMVNVVRENALSVDVADQSYRAWIARYPDQNSVYARYFQFLLERKAFEGAEKFIAQYHSAFPADEVFPVKARALLEYKKGSVEQGLAVYDTHFQPLWPEELVQSYFGLLTETRSQRKFLDRARAALEHNPDDLNAAARIFYLYQRQGRTDAAQQALTSYRLRKEQRNAKWTSDELYVLARLNEGIHSYPEAARYYYALYSAGDKQDSQQLALTGLAEVLLEAPEQPLRLGSGELSMYRDIAAADSGPGFLNGILSLVLNTTAPASQYSEEEQRAVPYFHRAEASELIRLVDARFPGAASRPALHARLMETYAAYGESEAVIRDGQQFLAAFPSAPQREQVALLMADAYARTNRAQEEFALYDALLAELAKKAQNVPLGAEAAERTFYNESQGAEASEEEGGGEQRSEDQVAERAQQQVRRAFEVSRATAEALPGVRSSQYARVLERYLSRLVSLNQVPQALMVLRKEVEHNPDDPGLYERLAQFLAQNRLGQQEEEVYQHAVQQFQDRSWYHKLARFYLREKRNTDFARLTEQVAQIFSGTELEKYFAAVVGPPEFYEQLNEYAHARFPHNLTFVRNLLGTYHIGGDTPAWQQLLREHWWEAEDLRNEFFEFLSRTGRLDQELAALKQAEANVPQRHWPELAASNPVAARFIGEAGFWRSHYEESAPVMGALAQQFPADAELGRRASAAYRSLAAFDARNTELAIGIEENLYQANPGNREGLARIGDILADRELFARAAPYWDRMMQVRPGEPQAFLEPATVYWDYYDFNAALRVLHEGRTKLGDESLYSFEEGAIYENQRDYSAAVVEYVKGALKEGGVRARNRLLALARRSKLREVVDKATANLGTGAAPDLEGVKLRIAVLETQNRPKDLEAFLFGIAERTSSLELLEWLEATARDKSLVALQQSVLERQAAVTTDPIRRLELRYSLVNFYEGKKDLAAAQRNVEALYRENPKILGVVRATVDFYWRNNEKEHAIDVLQQAAAASYPALRTQFNYETARKLTEAGQYEQARKLLFQLLANAPYNDEYLAATADTYARAGDDQGLKAFYLQKIEDFRKAPLAQDARNRQIAALRRGLIPALTRLKDYAGAVDHYIEIINRYPEDEALVPEAALYAQSHGRQAQLLDFYAKTVRESPRDYRWPMVLARMQAQLEDYAAAIQSYGTAINVRPDRVDLRTARAELYERLMRFDEAAAEYQRLFDLNYHDTRWMEKLAEMRARQGRTPETVAALQAALIDNRPDKPENFFEVARRLESWGMMPQARDFAAKGVESAGRDLLAVADHHQGAALYARIMTRLRQQDAAYQRLQRALADANSLTASIGVAVQQVEKQGLAGVTDQEWRQQALNLRMEAARNGLRTALRSMGVTVDQYYTPEEKLAFAGWLGNAAASANPRDLDMFFLPAAEAAVLPDLQARWIENLMMSNFGGAGAAYSMRLIDLQSHRLRFQELGVALERYAGTLGPNYRSPIFVQAANAYRAGGLYDEELRVLDAVQNRFGANVQERYFYLLLHRRPQELLQWASSSFPAAQYAVLHGDSKLALAAVSARGGTQLPVWSSAYTALTGLYFAERGPVIESAFVTTLGNGTVGEHVGKAVDRQRQLAGNTWFYYSSRYGEWLGATRSGDPEDFLPAVLEQSPASASGYVTTAEYYAEAGNFDRAIQDYAHTLELAPGRADIHDRIALLYWRQQKRTEAIAEWKQALKMLDAQVNQRKVPASFWPTLRYTLNHVGNRKLLAEVRTQAETVLRDYVRYNGEYQVEDLLREAFRAVGDVPAGTAWMLDLAAVAPEPILVLRLLANANWIPAPARDPIYQQLVKRLQDQLGAAEGLAADYARQELQSWQLRYARYLIDLKQFDRAEAVLQSLPKQPPSAAELELRFRIAIARSHFDSIVEQYRAAPDQAPPAEVLRAVARGLQTAGLRAPARKLWEFIFTQEIAAHHLSAANMLGLAEIRLQDGDTAGALELLNRLTLAVGQPFANLDAAASLLARNGHHAEAADFYGQLVKAAPWNTAARLRFAVEQLAAGRDSDQARALAVEVASSGAALYSDRLTAANLLNAGGRSTPALGSAELDLIARGIAPSAAGADKPYFYAARVKAAASAAPELRAQLLRRALDDAPGRDTARLPLFYALTALRRDQLAVSAVEPILRASILYARVAVPPEDTQIEDSEQSATPEIDSDSDSSAPYMPAQRRASELARMSDAERATLAFAVAKAYVGLDELQNATGYFQLAARLEKSRTVRSEIQKQLAALRATLRREANNLLRAPTLHPELEQEHVVRPRLLATAGRPSPPRPSQTTKGGRAQ